MSLQEIENNPSSNTVVVAGGYCIFDDAILNQWLRSDPAPGTYSEYRRRHAASRREASVPLGMTEKIDPENQDEQIEES